jgi:branched-chain amino acid transport system ATP-binding protein
VEKVSSGYGRTTVVREVTIEVPDSSVVALLGPNGAGKTTLLKTIAGLIRPTAGSVHLFGRPSLRSPPHRLAQRGLCLIPEGRAIFKSLSVAENLDLQAAASSNAAPVHEVFEQFPILGARLKQVAGTLSGGEQQMLAMARAYIKRPKLILVDEASFGLAPFVVDQIFDFMRRLTTEGTSLLVVDQYVHRALEMADHVYIMQHGYITFAGAAEELRDGSIFERYLGNDPVQEIDAERQHG